MSDKPNNDHGVIPSMPHDWTVGPDGRSNTSPEFLRLCAEVERIIRSDAHMLLNGRVDRTAGLVMAQLAHKQGVGPLAEMSARLSQVERERDAALENLNDQLPPIEAKMAEWQTTTDLLLNYLNTALGRPADSPRVPLAELIVALIGQRDEYRDDACAAVASLAIAIQDRDHAREEWHRHNERADHMRHLYSRAIEDRDSLSSQLAEARAKLKEVIEG